MSLQSWLLVIAGREYQLGPGEGVVVENLIDVLDGGGRVATDVDGTIRVEVRTSDDVRRALLEAGSAIVKYNAQSVAAELFGLTETADGDVHATGVVIDGALYGNAPDNASR